MRLPLVVALTVAITAAATELHVARERGGVTIGAESVSSMTSSVDATPAPSWHNMVWLNADAPVTLESLRGRVVLLNFWTFICSNCINTVPALTTLDAKYRARGLSLIGIHTPEFAERAGEHDSLNVRRALTRNRITYPNTLDNDRATWRAYNIRYWPSMVLIDKAGNIRHETYGEVHVGDRRYAEWERQIEALLRE